MRKKIAVLVRDRQEEALRMSLGITLLEDTIDVFIIDGPVRNSDENIMNIGTMKEMGMDLYTNFQCDANPDIAYMPVEEMAKKLPGYDIILPY